MNNREIDRLVAEKVLGLTVKNENIVRGGRRSGIPSYSQKIEYAWLVVESLRERKIFTIYDAWDEKDEKIFCANFQYNDTYHVVDYSAYADTAPMAICLAALKVVGIESSEEAK
ncbi:hypothetical protein K7T73_06890 [Bacillus badius]|uniref:BC1872 family protein n=1 Tax=Bacillus badius TaxID=1455 RepID=UPI001CBC1322|nr:hypothetical protein [Bacillus badius]UAT31940.1 hypothetical protein K7T73_06890 [Bacillus badius]